VNKNGPGLLARAHPTRPTRTDAFQGILGPTLGGGIGNGLVKPSDLRPRPPFLNGTDSTVLLGSVTMDRREIQMSSPSWETPLRCPHQGGRYGAVYIKGITKVTFQIHPITPTPTGTPGFRMSDIVGSRFRSLQKRALASL
jgi:hypothetical protein